MKVLILNGSPRKNGNTALALSEVRKTFVEEGIEVEYFDVGHLAVRGCIACGRCGELEKCVFDDIVNTLAPIFRESDGLVVGSPVYYASANATLIALLDRLFYSTPYSKEMKVGFAITVARRGGASATFDELNKYFTISGMPVVSGQYWNSVHGMLPGEASADEEGMQNMRTLARNAAFLIKSIRLGKEAYGTPVREARKRTNFIR